MKERTKSFIAGMLVMLLIVSLSVTAFAAYQKNAVLEYADITGLRPQEIYELKARTILKSMEMQWIRS